MANFFCDRGGSRGEHLAAAGTWTSSLVVTRCYQRLHAIYSMVHFFLMHLALHRPMKTLVCRGSLIWTVDGIQHGWISGGMEQMVFSRPIREILKGVPLVQPRSPFKWDFCGLLAVLQAFATLGSLLQTILSPSRQPSADRIELGTSRVMDGGDQICLCLVRFLFTSWRVTDGMMKGQECETYFHRRRVCCWIKHGLQVANPCGLCRSSQVNVKWFPKGLSLQL